MKITIYELLGMIKDGNAPEEIKYDGTIYKYDDYKGDKGYVDKTQNPYKWFEHEIDCDVKQYLNDEVEILEEEKKIPEKLFFTHISNYNDQSVVNNNFNNYFKKTQETINQLIDYLKSKGDE